LYSPRAVIAAVSPAVVIPCVRNLEDRGYGRSKGIPTLVIAAATFDDVIAISVFSVVLSIIFSTGDK
jgi:NhaP-type Na+/H+ or K+/H+ antiporter